MRPIARMLFSIFLWPVLAGGVISSPVAGGEEASRKFSQGELDQLLAPIALYPDELLSQILMASTYPLEVVEAARWSREHDKPKGDEAVRRVTEKDWDPSVKSLVAFPQILQVMDEKLEWTQQLGDAYLVQEAEMMDRAQYLRRKAIEAGNLRSNDYVVVRHDGPAVVIVYAHPGVVWVPYYDPFWVYGPWWWPAYRPWYWDPWPGYSYPSGVRVGFVWGVSTNVRVGFFFGGFNWSRRCARIAYVNHYHYYYGPRTVTRVDVWRHDPAHRKGVVYRSREVRERFHRRDGDRSPSAVRRRIGGDQLPDRGAGSRPSIDRSSDGGSTTPRKKKGGKGKSDGKSQGGGRGR